MKKMITMLAVVLMIGVLSPSVAAMAATPTPTPASSGTLDLTVTDDMKEKLNNFKPLWILKGIAFLVGAYYTVIGGIQLQKSINEVSTAIRQNDGASLNGALTGLGASAIQTFGPALLAIFGIVI